ncbi:MAG: 2'-5' RNA ligase family protein [Caldisericota bacterium]|jgi:2'-5' RNA ligase|nr:2'-5' RNA ligase family protein [Caldisericota bacterium]
MEYIERGFRESGAVTICITGDAGDYINTFRHRFDPYVERIMPHITLMFAQDLDVAMWQSVRLPIQEGLAHITPFRVCVGSTGVFHGDTPVLWLLPEDEHGEIAAIRGVLLGATSGVAVERVRDFVPHISIGFFDQEESLMSARQAVDTDLQPFDFRVAFLSFLRADDNDVWHCVDTLNLGESGSSTIQGC